MDVDQARLEAILEQLLDAMMLVAPPSEAKFNLQNRIDHRRLEPRAQRFVEEMVRADRG